MAQLRAVQPDEKKPARKLSVAEAAATGDYRSLLVAMRERIAVAVSGDCSPRDLAALTRRLQDISCELAALDLRAAEEGGDVDFIDDDPGGTFDASAI